MTRDTGRGEKYRLSARGIAIYVTLWATIFAVVRVLAKHSSIGASGAYPYSAALVTDFLLPVAIGLVFIAIGVTAAYFFGKIRHVAAIAVWCFVIGCLALPMLWITLVVLAGIGLLSLD